MTFIAGRRSRRFRGPDAKGRIPSYDSPRQLQWAGDIQLRRAQPVVLGAYVIAGRDRIAVDTGEAILRPTWPYVMLLIRPKTLLKMFG